MDSYKLLVNLPDTVVFLSPDLKVLEATDAYLASTLKTREEFVGKNFFATYPDNPTDKEATNMLLVRNSMLRAVETKETDYIPSIRYDIPKPESQGGGFDVRYWEAIHKPVLDDDGNVAYLIHRATDITQKVLFQKAAELEESKCGFIMNTLPHLIYTSDATGKATFFNQKWYDYTGTTPEILTTNNWHETIHPDDLPKVEAKVEAAIQNGTEFQMELRVKNRNGSYRWFLTRSIPMRGENNEILFWVGSSVDIQSTRELVQELEQSYQQLSDMSEQVMEGYRKAEAQHKTLHNLIMKAPVFFCVLRGPEHRYELMNEQYQKLFPNRNLIGQSVAEALPEVAEQGFVKVLDEVYATGKEYIAERIPVKLDRYGNGELEDMTLTFMYQTIYDESNEPTGIMVCGFNVGEQMRSNNN